MGKCPEIDTLIQTSHDCQPRDEDTRGILKVSHVVNLTTTTDQALSRLVHYALTTVLRLMTSRDCRSYYYNYKHNELVIARPFQTLGLPNLTLV